MSVLSSYYSPEYLRGCGYRAFRRQKRKYDEWLKELQMTYADYGRSFRKKTPEELAELSVRDREVLDELLALAPVFKELNKSWNAKKKETLDNLTDENVKFWVENFSPEDPAAVVSNTWTTYMGRIGSTSATITVGKGKEKPFSRWDVPSWTPIGVAKWTERYPSWMGGPARCEKIITSWKDVEDALSSYENQTICLYKLPGSIR